MPCEVCKSSVGSCESWCPRNTESGVHANRNSTAYRATSAKDYARPKDRSQHPLPTEETEVPVLTQAGFDRLGVVMYGLPISIFVILFMGFTSCAFLLLPLWVPLSHLVNPDASLAACPAITTAMTVHFFGVLCTCLLVWFLSRTLYSSMHPILKPFYTWDGGKINFDGEDLSGGKNSPGEREAVLEKEVNPKMREHIGSWVYAYYLLVLLCIFLSCWWIYGLTLLFGTPEISDPDFEQGHYWKPTRQYGYCALQVTLIHTATHSCLHGCILPQFLPAAILLQVDVSVVRPHLCRSNAGGLVQSHFFHKEVLSDLDLVNRWSLCLRNTRIWSCPDFRWWFCLRGLNQLLSPPAVSSSAEKWFTQ